MVACDYESHPDELEGVDRGTHGVVDFGTPGVQTFDHGARHARTPGVLDLEAHPDELGRVYHDSSWLVALDHGGSRVHIHGVVDNVGMHRDALEGVVPGIPGAVGPDGQGHHEVQIGADVMRVEMV